MAPTKVLDKDGRITFDFNLKPEFEASLEPDCTYMLIFSPNTYNALEKFKEQFKGKILFESQKAINTTHFGSPRNTLVIFEKADDETTS